MARVDCCCPLSASGARRVHASSCPNRKRGKGTQPKDYTDRPRVPRTYTHARLATERLRDLLTRMMATPVYFSAENRVIEAMVIADCRLQVETVRRYLDGE